MELIHNWKYVIFLFVYSYLNDFSSGGDRAPGVTAHQKYERYYLNSSLWCDDLRPCPVHGGSPSASHNSQDAAKAFLRDASWSSGVISKAALADGVWVQYSYPDGQLAVGSFTFQSNDDIRKFVFEGSNGTSFVELSTAADGSSTSRRVINPRGKGPRSFRHYRLRVTETKWSANGQASGSVTIGNLQLCLVDKFDNLNDNPYVATPPFLSHVQAKPFASSKWSNGWHYKDAFTYPHRTWCTKYLYTKSGDRNGVLAEPQYIGYTFPVERIVRKVKFMAPSYSSYLKHCPATFHFQGSNDKRTWTTLSYQRSFGQFRTTDEEKEIEIPEHKLAPFKHYRFLVTRTDWSRKGGSGGYLMMRSIRFC